MTNPILQFGFCIYGTERKYYQGLIENLDLLNKWQETDNEVEIRVIISYIETAKDEYIKKYSEYPFVLMQLHKDHSLSPMISRLLNIDTIETNTYYFSRDADSRITKRDQWCIKQFIESNKMFHVIRDHHYHVKRIMGGTFGIKKPHTFPNIESLVQQWRSGRDVTRYGSDEGFLEESLYPLIEKDCLIHSNIVGYKGETVQPILYELEHDGDFIGNVYDYHPNNKKPHPVFGYKEHIGTEDLHRMWNQEQYGIFVGLMKYIDFGKISPRERMELLNKCYYSYAKLSDEKGMETIRSLIQREKERQK